MKGQHLNLRHILFPTLNQADVPLNRGERPYLPGAEVVPQRNFLHAITH